MSDELKMVGGPIICPYCHEPYNCATTIHICADDSLESMSEAELDAELRTHGVDPEKLIQSAFQKVCVLAKNQADRIRCLESSLADSSVVHSNILRGTIALTKAQAIHIAGLPADIESKLQTAEAALGTLMLWIEEANAKVTDEEWSETMLICVEGKPDRSLTTRPEVDALLASRLQQLRDKVAELQLGKG